MKFPFWVFDSASDPSALTEFQQQANEHLCLFRGHEEDYLKNVAPFLFDFDWKSKFTTRLISKNWGMSNTVGINSNDGFSYIFKHLRKFLMVKTEDGQQLYFRFYDPRVLRIFLPTCDASQLKEFFGPVEEFICEDEDPAFALIFSLDKGNLVTERMPAETLFPGLEKEHNETIPAPESNRVVPPKKESSFAEQPLEYAEFDGDPELMKSYLSGIPIDKLADAFSVVQNFYVLRKQGGSGGFVFSFSQDTGSFIAEEVSDEVLASRLMAAEKKREENQKAFSQSILKTKKKQDETQVPGDEPKKSKTWSWLKI